MGELLSFREQHRVLRAYRHSYTETCQETLWLQQTQELTNLFLQSSRTFVGFIDIIDFFENVANVRRQLRERLNKMFRFIVLQKALNLFEFYRKPAPFEPQGHYHTNLLQIISGGIPHEYQVVRRGGLLVFLAGLVMLRSLTDEIVMSR